MVDLGVSTRPKRPKGHFFHSSKHQLTPKGVQLFAYYKNKPASKLKY